MTPTLRLTIIEPADYPQASRVRAITGEGLRIGRGSDNDWVISDSARLMSRGHCTIDFKTGLYVLIDTSANGVFLNDKPQPIGRGNSSVLSDGDRLRFPGMTISVSLLEHEEARDAFRAVLPSPPDIDTFAASGQQRQPLDDLLDQPAARWSGAPGFTMAPFAPTPLTATSFDDLAMVWPQQHQTQDFRPEAGGDAWSGVTDDSWPESGHTVWPTPRVTSPFEDRSPPEQQAFQSALPGQALIPEGWDEDELAGPPPFAPDAPGAAPVFGWSGSPDGNLATDAPAAQAAPWERSQPDLDPAWLAPPLAAPSAGSTESAVSWPPDLADLVARPAETTSTPVTTAVVTPEPTADTQLLLAMTATLSRIERSVARPGEFILLGGEPDALLDWLRTFDPVVAAQGIADIGDRILATLPMRAQDATNLADNDQAAPAASTGATPASGETVPPDWLSAPAAERPSPASTPGYTLGSAKESAPGDNRT